MSYIGKRLRLQRFIRSDVNCGVIVPIDHGLTMGPITGINTLQQISNWISHPIINGIIAHKGMVEKLALAGLLNDIAVMIHLNGMSAHAVAPNNKEIVTTIESALALGADAVSLQLNYDGTNDAHNITLLGRVVDEAQQYGLPVLTMIYDKSSIADDIDKRKEHERFRHLLRISYELGTDAIKIAAPSSHNRIPEIIAEIPEGLHTFFAGGDLIPDQDVFKIAKTVSTTGRAGLCMGRNIFARKYPYDFLNALSNYLKQKKTSIALLKNATNKWT